MKCFSCGAEVTNDEAGLNRKLTTRDCTQFLCVPCLAQKFEVEEKRLYEKIEEYRKVGCVLFSQNK